MEKTFFKKELPIKALDLWADSPRLCLHKTSFEPSQKTLIRWFCENPSFQMLELAEDIIRDFGMPQLRYLVAYGDNEKYVVIDGNRRLVIYKLLADPDLAHDGKWRKYFMEHKKRLDVDENFLLECITAKQKEPLLPYLERIHLNE